MSANAKRRFTLRDSRPHFGPSARQLARPGAPGVAPVATRQSIGRGKPFPSAGCASASEKTEATGGPFAPPVRLSAPTGHGRLAPPLREGLRPSDETEASDKRRGTLREERAGRPSAERRETGGRGSPHAPRRTRGARSRLRGDEAPHGDSRMRAAGADGRRTAARPRTARKAEGPTRRTRPAVANAARFGAAAGRTVCRTRRVGQDCGLRLTSRSPHGRQDAQVARPEAGAPLPRSAPHVGKRQNERCCRAV